MKRLILIGILGLTFFGLIGTSWAYQTVVSWYGEYFHGKTMANGKPYNMFGFTVAHKTLPKGIRVKVTNPENGRSVYLTVTDRGPYIYGREFDLSYGAALVLGLVDQGIAKVEVEVLWPKSKFYTYRVRKGNTLWKLFGPKWKEIARINKIDPSQLEVGIKLKVPYDWDNI